MSYKVLVVDDERPLTEIVQFLLEKEGYQVTCAFDGLSALEKVLDDEPDLVLLDQMLPVMNGVEVCRQLRLRQKTMPVMMLTARDSENDKVKGLESGADDYVTKPFSNRELVARVHALLRRQKSLSQSVPKDSYLRIGSLTIDQANGLVYQGEQSVDITEREFSLLCYLIDRRGVVVTRQQLLQEVWQSRGNEDSRVVDVCIKRLREKIEEDPKNPKYILTRRRAGYMWRSSERS